MGTIVQGCISLPPMAALEEANQRLEDSTSAILKALKESGISSSSIKRLKATLNEEAHARALQSAQLYTKCYPYMDTPKLIDLLAESWEALCNRRDVELKDVNRKIDRIRNNPKMAKRDPTGEKLKQQEEFKTKIIQEKKTNQIGLYRIRALKSLYIQERANQSNAKRAKET